MIDFWVWFGILLYCYFTYTPIIACYIFCHKLYSKGSGKWVCDRCYDEREY